MVASLNLRNDISSLPIYFSQVREDPELDCRIISSLNRPSKVLMVSSGGDTLCRIASQPSVVSIDSVDANQAQLDISRLKLTLLKFSSENRLRILGHEAMDKDIRWQIVCEICRELKIDINSLGPEELIFNEGLDYSGRYEQLFKGIQSELRRRGISSYELKSKISEVEKVFTEFFDLDVLVDIFGKEATQNPQEAFYSHFFRQLKEFLGNDSSMGSPFLNQMLFGTFAVSPYEWLKSPARKQSDLCETSFHKSMMLDFLINSKDYKYDFIHLSNILDWLSEEDAGLLLDNAFRALKRGGKLIVRQLNSSLDICPLNSKIKWDLQTSNQLKEQDSSFFYRKVLVGGKDCG